MKENAYHFLGLQINLLFTKSRGYSNTKNYTSTYQTNVMYLKQLVLISQVIPSTILIYIFLGLIWSHVSQTTICRLGVDSQFSHVNITVTDYVMAVKIIYYSLF